MTEMNKHPDCKDICQIREHKGYHTCSQTGRCEDFEVMSDAWKWAQPTNRKELLCRLRDAFELNVNQRERENLCSCAYHEIKSLEYRLTNERKDILSHIENAEARISEFPFKDWDVMKVKQLLLGFRDVLDAIAQEKK